LRPSTPRPDSGRPGQRPLGDNGAPRVVSLLSDYGLADGFVGALHSVLRARLPQVPIVDITHEVPPQDVRAGSLALQRAAPYLAEGVVVAIVDPGVGTPRRAIALRAGSADLTFVGPDNGLMLPAVDVLGGPALAVELQNPEHQLAGPGPTFAGRDIFAPAAAFLAAGGDIGDLGRPLDMETLVRLPPPVCRKSRGWLEVEVTWVDRFGNVQLAAGPDVLGGRAGSGGRVTVTSTPGGRPAAAETWPARIVRTYGDLVPGELGILVDSYGSLALCLNGAGAAQLLGTRERDVLRLRPAGAPRDEAPVPSGVSNMLLVSPPVIDQEPIARDQGVSRL
jgi:S-adenosyl-L-methionine hydrolase (adenosine-forming)